MQEAFEPDVRVIECVLLSGLLAQPFKKPLAGMVIRGSGPYLLQELYGSRTMSGFPDPDLTIIWPIQVLTSYTSFTDARYGYS
jgi:hypothetical protein